MGLLGRFKPREAELLQRLAEAEEVKARAEIIPARDRLAARYAELCRDRAARAAAAEAEAAAKVPALRAEVDRLQQQVRHLEWEAIAARTARAGELEQVTHKLRETVHPDLRAFERDLGQALQAIEGGSFQLSVELDRYATDDERDAAVEESHVRRAALLEAHRECRRSLELLPDRAALKRVGELRAQLTGLTEFLAWAAR